VGAREEAKDTFGAVSISVTFVAEIKAVTGAGVFQRCRTVDEKYGVIDVAFFAQFREERMGEHVRSGCLEIRM
jgi:hypothetical protein